MLVTMSSIRISNNWNYQKMLITQCSVRVRIRCQQRVRLLRTTDCAYRTDCGGVWSVSRLELWFAASPFWMHAIKKSRDPVDLSSTCHSLTLPSGQGKCGGSRYIWTPMVTLTHLVCFFFMRADLFLFCFLLFTDLFLFRLHVWVWYSAASSIG